MDEDGGRVVGNHIDAAELLHEHDNPCGQGCASVPWDREELGEHCEEVLPLLDLVLEGDPHVRVVEISCCLEIGVAKGLEGSERLFDFAVLNEPPGGFWAEVDLQADNDWKDYCGAKLETPGEVAGNG